MSRPVSPRACPARPHLLACALWALALAGCYPSLPKDLASLGPMDACPSFSAGELQDKVRRFNHGTDLFTLRCALGQLRGMKLSEVHRTPMAAKICFLLAERTVDSASEQEKLAAEGVRWAEIAQPKDAPPDGAIQYYYAVNLGMVVRKHITLAATHLSRLKKALETAFSLAPDVDQGGPGRVLGVLYLMAPPWPQGIGDSDRAAELLKQAVEAFPNHPQNHFFYAKALWETEQDDARKEIQKHLDRAEHLLAQKDYAEIADQWTKDVKKFAEQLKISLAPKPREEPPAADTSPAEETPIPEEPAPAAPAAPSPAAPAPPAADGAQ